MRIIARFSKTESARFISHLDIQRLFGRAFRRAGLPVTYSQGFNPHPVLSFATALSTGVTSDAEWLDVKLDSSVDCTEFVARLNLALPDGFRINEAHEAEDKLASLTALLSSAEYTVSIRAIQHAGALEAALESLMSGPIVIQKHTKGGIKPVDIRPMIHSAKIIRSAECVELKLEGILNATGSLNADAFTAELMKCAGINADYSINRDAVVFEGGLGVPGLKNTREADF